LHVGDDPAPLRPFVQAADQLSDARRPVVGPFAIRVRVVDDERESRALARGGPFEHLEVAVRIAERHDWTATYDLLDAHGLARLVIDELDAQQACDDGMAAALLVLHLDPAANHVLRRDAIDTFGERADHFHAASGHDVGL